MLLLTSSEVSLLSPRASDKEMCVPRQVYLMDQGKQDTVEITNFNDTALEI